MDVSKMPRRNKSRDKDEAYFSNLRCLFFNDAHPLRNPSGNYYPGVFRPLVERPRMGPSKITHLAPSENRFVI